MASEQMIPGLCPSSLNGLRPFIIQESGEMVGNRVESGQKAIPALTGLRFVAAMFVVLTHAMPTIVPVKKRSIHILPAGTESVQSRDAAVFRPLRLCDSLWLRGLYQKAWNGRRLQLFCRSLRSALPLVFRVPDVRPGDQVVLLATATLHGCRVAILSDLDANLDLQCLW